MQQPCPPDVQIVHMVSRAAAVGMSNEISETLSSWLLAVSRRDHFRIILVNQGKDQGVPLDGTCCLQRGLSI